MPDAGSLGGAHHGARLLELVGALFPEIGDQKSPVCAFERGLEGFRAIEVRFDDFVGKSAMLGWIAGEGAYLEFAARFQRAQDSAALLAGCPDHRDQFSV